MIDRMRVKSILWPARSMLTLVVLCLAASGAGEATAQTGDAFVPLFDGRTLDGWVIENTEAGNFTVQDQVLRVEGPEGWLRTEQQYADFVLRVGFRFLTDDADSGIFVRTDGETPFFRGWPGDSYQIQTRDISTNTSNRPLPIGQVYRHGTPDGETVYDSTAAFDAFKATGQWQDLEVEVVADSIVVRLNSILVTRAGNIVNATGYIGLQGEAGIVEFRSIEIKER